MDPPFRLGLSQVTSSMSAMIVIVVRETTIVGLLTYVCTYRTEMLCRCNICFPSGRTAREDVDGQIYPKVSFFHYYLLARYTELFTPFNTYTCAERISPSPLKGET